METKKKAAPRIADLEAHLGYRLRRVSNQVSGAFARALQAEGLSVAEWVALRLIHGDKGEARLTSSRLAEAAGLTRGAVSKVLEKLEAKALVARSPHEEDSRVHWLALTRKGAGLLPRLAALADANDARFFEVLEAQERAALGRLLDKLAKAHQLRNVPVD